MIRIQDIFPNRIELLNTLPEAPICIDCSLMDYREALDVQQTLHGKVSSHAIPSVMLLVEHPSVITLGLHKDHNQLLRPESQLNDMGIDVVPIRRGGGSTAHNPGQLVIYPIVDLVAFGFRVAPFVHYLEQIAIDVLEKTGVLAIRRNRYPGLWVDGKKIASIGIQIARKVSMHGIAINLHNDLDIFDHIVPCGIEGVRMTNICREGGEVLPMQNLKEVVQASCISRMPEYVGSRKEIK